jgi:hypothetical protein
MEERSNLLPKNPAINAIHSIALQQCMMSMILKLAVVATTGNY